MEERLVIGLLGLLATAIVALVYVVKRRPVQTGLSVAQLEALNALKEHMDEAERRLHDNVNTTRHDLKNALQAIILEVRQVLRDERRGR